MRIGLIFEDVEDKVVRDNFRRLQNSIDAEDLFKPGFRFFSIPVPAAGSNLTFKHNLGFVPKDVILLSVTSGADVTFHYDLFDFNNIVFTSTLATTIRCFLGKYNEGILR